MSPEAIHISENGSPIGVWNTTISSSFQPTFRWQILAAQTTPQATLSDILIAPPVFISGANTPSDIAFSNVNGMPMPATDVWQITKQVHGPIPLNFSSSGYMRFSTRRLAIANSWVSTQGLSPLPSEGILMYCLRVNASGHNST
jgi:hypothetical protein